jgi:hypothetical protein
MVDRAEGSVLVQCDCGARWLFTGRIDTRLLRDHMLAAGCNPNQIPTGRRADMWGTKRGVKSGR